jgi:hypothetical protein
VVKSKDILRIVVSFVSCFGVPAPKKFESGSPYLDISFLYTENISNFELL